MGISAPTQLRGEEAPWRHLSCSDRGKQPQGGGGVLSAWSSQHLSGRKLSRNTDFFRGNGLEVTSPNATLLMVKSDELKINRTEQLRGADAAEQI